MPVSISDHISNVPTQFLPRTFTNLGTLGSTSQVVSDEVYDPLPTRTYQFSLAQASNINLVLHNNTGDADLSLYADTNNNGRLDSTDRLVRTSSRSGYQDDFINSANQAAGTYFAQVKNYNGSDVSFKLGLQAKPVKTPSDLIGIVASSNGGAHYTGAVGDTATARFYSFSAGGGAVDINLTGLTADADIRLIQDRNNNGIVDAGEVLKSSTVLGTGSESIRTNLAQGGYAVEVYQYTGNTSYSLDISAYTVLR